MFFIKKLVLRFYERVVNDKRGIWPIIPFVAKAAASAGISSGISKLLGGGNKKGGGVQQIADPYGETRNALQKWLVPQIGKEGPRYSGDFVAGMSPYESQSFDFLRQYGEQGVSPTQNLGKAEIAKTLTNQYDPSSSPYYQAVKAQANKNLEETQKNIADKSAGAGRYWSGARLKQQSDAAENVNMALNAMLGKMAEQERMNRLSVIPQALAYGEAEQQLPLQQATAYQALGALPRSIEQAGNQAKLQDWLRSTYDYPMDIARLTSKVQTPPIYQSQNPSGISQLLGGLGQGIGSNLPQLLQGLFKKKPQT